MSSANNKEAKSGLNRYLELKKKEAGVLESNPNLRPKYVQLVESIPQADKWRSTVVSEISVKLGKINDPSVGVFQIRDLNDDLNKLFREKRAWEYHIKEIGGPDYITQRSEVAGIEVNGYRYFGRAKELPDAKEVIEQKIKDLEERSSRRERNSKEKIVEKEREARTNNGAYYGLYEESSMNSGGDFNEVYSKVLQQVADITDIEMDSDLSLEKRSQDPILEYEAQRGAKILQMQIIKEKETDDGVLNVGHVPTLEEISRWLVEKKRQQLLDRIKLAN